ncbi:MAG: AI-2E family transporter [Candidatus Shapirobacteria bacterium]|nr:AI-2E family transporter [Candidatus Shapirobacteria bacterium]
MKSQRVEISYRTIIFTVMLILGIFLVWFLKEILVLFFICFIFMEALNPLVTRLEKYKLPRPLSIVLIYITILSIISFAFAGIIPLLIEQTTGLINTLPQDLANTSFFGASASDISSQFKILETLPGDIARTAFSVVADVVSTLIIFVVTFYMLLERKNLNKYGFSFLSSKVDAQIRKIFNLLEKKLGYWVHAEIILMTTIGVLSYIGFSLLGLKYAVPLAIIAGLLEVVPNVGPIIATALAALVGLTISPITALLAVGWGVLIQQLENHIIVPKVMKETVGISPLITIFLLITGAKLGGIVGAILAIPIYITIETIFTVLTDKSEK